MQGRCREFDLAQISHQAHQAPARTVLSAQRLRCLASCLGLTKTPALGTRCCRRSQRGAANPTMGGPRVRYLAGADGRAANRGLLH